MGQRRNKKGNKKIIWKHMKVKIQNIKTYGMQQKQQIFMTKTLN